MHPDDPRHGTNAGYVAGCREPDCRTAHARDRKRYRDRAYLNRGPLTIDGTPTRRRIQALMAIGWSSRELDKRLGHNPTYTYKILASDGPIHLATARTYADLYDQLCMTRPTSDDPNMAAVIRRNRNEARRKGYVPPLGWDDIEDLNERPSLARDRDGRPRDDYDPARVERILGGDWSLAPGTRKLERIEIIQRWAGSLYELEQITGWKIERDYRKDGAA